ncbi:DUF503 family protein [Candidatus Kuenenia stuttgartensis]|uniref:DUF503 family protein n=1 Tax=Kuenenia stuttgartiensis TaxID=174633 RepID=UPI00146EECAB
MNLEFYKSDDTIVGLLCVQLILRNARTLKEKRRVIKSLKDRVKNNFNVSISKQVYWIIVSILTWELRWWERQTVHKQHSFQFN